MHAAPGSSGDGAGAHRSHLRSDCAGRSSPRTPDARERRRATQSLDAIGHYYLRYAMPAAFGDVTDDERRRFGSVLESHYGYIDDAIGRAIDSLGPDDLLLVVSGYGMEPLGFGKRLLERDDRRSGAERHARERARRLPDGVRRVGRPRRGFCRAASVVDVVPTMLYFLGLPIGRDMDGYARTDLFQRAFTDERPITFIPTYDR